MKYDETPRTPPIRLAEAQQIGQLLQELRKANELTQSDVAARAGVSRSTAVLIEKGDESRTLAQLLRYLHAIEPELSLVGLLLGQSSAVRNKLAHHPMRQHLQLAKASALGPSVLTATSAPPTSPPPRERVRKKKPAATSPAKERDPYDF
jgi:transcriptional regulator with XRE-family HTH domain